MVYSVNIFGVSFIDVFSKDVIMIVGIIKNWAKWSDIDIVRFPDIPSWKLMEF